MESQLWAIGIKEDSCSLSDLRSRVKELATVSVFKVPKKSLRVGTLDSLMSLSDDLAKMDILAEATVTKLYKQLQDLKPGEEATILGVPVVRYATLQWDWDEAKFQVKTPLREMSESISMRLSALDDELKLKVSELNALKGTLQAIERKTQGNLMVRGLADVISEQDVMESDYMTTVYVVVPKASMKEFETSYEKMAMYVVPKSGKLIMEDLEYGLYTCIMFRKSLDDFKANAREKRFTLREFTYDPNALAAEEAKKSADTAESDKLKKMLENWCHINYAECFTMMMHLKAVRIFVESVLRYGLTSSVQGMEPNFNAFLLQPKKGQPEKLRKVLAEAFGGGGMDGGDEEMVVPGAQGEFYPYVYTPIETEPNVTM